MTSCIWPQLGGIASENPQFLTKDDYKEILLAADALGISVSKRSYLVSQRQNNCQGLCRNLPQKEVNSIGEPPSRSVTMKM